MITTRLYENVTDKDIVTLEAGVVPARGRVSVSSAYHDLNPDRYPGLVEVTDLSKEDHEAKVKAVKLEVKNV